MFSLSDALSIVIGLVSIYLLFSIIVSYGLELIASLFQMRSKNLANAIQCMLDPSAPTLAGAAQVKKAWAQGLDIWDKGLADKADLNISEAVIKQLNTNPVKAFYSHPIIQTLSKPNQLPSYIQPGDFSNALFDLLTKAGTPDPTKPEEVLTSIKQGVAGIEDPLLKGTILPLIQNAEIMEQDNEKRIALARTNIETWFNNTMDRASGWYKRSTVWIAILIGLIVAILLNIDTLAIVQSLWANSSLRQSVGSAAVAYIQQNQDQNANQALAELSSLNLPLGWNGVAADRNPQTPLGPQEFPVLPGEISLKVLGLLITGLAISQGSSIWFDILQMVLNINLRSSGAKPSTDNSTTSTAAS
ncbi:MAG: hypothetical protein P4L50_06050 [Anaerolineaceae bacterium]|nr:hypothetical protein [Anaerolineaceae bacterium]